MQRAKWVRKVLTPVVGGLLILVVTACSGSHHSAAPSPSTTLSPSPEKAISPPAATGNHPYWLLEDFSVGPLLNAGLSSTLLRQYFNNPQTFVIVKPRATIPDARLPSATYVMSFANSDQLQQAITSGSIPKDVRYVLYDNEHWAATPSQQQAQPFSYAAGAQRLAHQHGLGLIFTPAANLSTVLDPSYTNTTKYNGYLNLSVAAQAARVTDIFEIQGQQDEGLPGFDNFVTTAVGQAHGANPDALIMLGLTTSAPGQQITGQSLLEDYQMTRAMVSGYWLNIPGGTSQGPRNPGVAVAFLEDLAPTLGYAS